MKIQSISKRRLRELILSLGFQEEEGKHHLFFYFRYKGKIYVRTKISHGGSKDVSQPILGLVGKQLCLTRQEFEGFLSGKLSKGEYIKILEGKRIL